MWAMSREQKEKGAEWLYRAIMIAIATSVWFKVDQIPVQANQIKDHDRRLDKLDAAVFSPAWHSKKETVQPLKIFEYTQENISHARHQLDSIEHSLSN